jgi:hypothetical protein
VAYKKTGGHFESASRIAADDIFLFAGEWTRNESTVGRKTIVHYSKAVLGEEFVVQALVDPETQQEADFVQFVKGGPNAEPIHKFDMIRDLLFGGDEIAAMNWVANNAPQEHSWIVDLGCTIQAIEGIGAPDVDEESRISELAADQKLRMQAVERAKQAIAEEAYKREGRTPNPLVLTAWLKEPDEDEQYRIDKLWVKSGNNFVVAPNKAGKTTLVLNVLKNLVDGGLFLGKFNTLPVKRNVGVINFELSPSQYKRWLRRMGITNTDNVKVWNLRGKPNPFRTPTSRSHFIQQLIDENIEVLIIDPFSSAFTGKNAKENEEVKEFLLMVDSLVAQGKVEEYLLVVHAGHDGTRARGASTLADHPDATWFIGKGEAGRQRTFRAEGRDVNYPEEALALGEDGITLFLTGLSRADSVLESMKQKVDDFVCKNPDCTASQLEAAITGANSLINAARVALVAEGKLIETVKGQSKKFRSAD